MRIFVLEDDRQRNLWFRDAATGLDVTFAESCGEARIKFAPPYDVMFLDHDLEDRTFVDSSDENTGAAFVRWIPPCTSPHTKIIVHSFNPCGVQTMIRILTEKGYRAHSLPFGPTVLSIMKSLGEKEQQYTTK